MRKRSFTLLELLVTIGIIAILASIAFGGMSYATQRANESKTIAAMEEFISALENFKLDYGFYPIIDGTKEVEVDFSNAKWDLFTNKNNDNKKKKAYMEGATGSFVDAWGRPFMYKYPGTKNKAKFDLWSLGEKVTKDDDDICSWKQK